MYPLCLVQWNTLNIIVCNFSTHVKQTEYLHTKQQHNANTHTHQLLSKKAHINLKLKPVWCNISYLPFEEEVNLRKEKKGKQNGYTILQLYKEGKAFLQNQSYPAFLKIINFHNIFTDRCDKSSNLKLVDCGIHGCGHCSIFNQCLHKYLDVCSWIRRYSLK